jgi:hypothetical protein
VGGFQKAPHKPNVTSHDQDQECQKVRIVGRFGPDAYGCMEHLGNLSMYSF